VSDNGQFIGSRSKDRSVRVWKFENGRQIAVMMGHVGPVT
jgi:hypothetical protein